MRQQRASPGQAGGLWRGAALVGAALCFACAAELPVAERPLDVILIVVDTLRADHLGLYGYAKPTSPNLDAFAREGIVFDDVTAQAPWTTPSVASLFSSLHPSAHGIRYRLEANRSARLSKGRDTLAELLARAGWVTLGVAANPWLGPETGLAQGFESYTLLSGVKSPAPAVNRIALERLDADPRRPFFLYLHYMDVHGPYHAPQPFQARFQPARATAPLPPRARAALPGYLRLDSARSLAGYIGAYDAGIRYWDENFAQLLAQLEARGLLENALVVVTSDHGEEFLEHGGFGHGRTLFQEQVHVPLVFWSRALGLGPGTVEHPVALIDVAPSVLGLLGLPAPEAFQGLDRRGLMVHRKPRARPVFSEAAVRIGGFPPPSGALRAVRAGDWKVVENLKTGELRLFDLGQDPEEGGRAAGPADRERARDLFRAWEQANRRLAEEAPAAESTLDDDTRERLEAIGYVDQP